MVEQIITPCAVCGMELHQIGICPACGHNQKVLDDQENDVVGQDFHLTYGVEFAPHFLEQIRIPYGINHAP